MTRTCRPGRVPGPRRLVAVAIPLAVALLAACGGGSGTGGTVNPDQGNGAQGGQTGQGGRGGGPPGVTGKIAEASRSGTSNGTLQVQGTDTQTTVTYTAKTQFSEEVKATLRVGDCVTVVGTPAAGQTDAVTATTVRVTAASGGTCSFQQGGMNGPGRSGAPPSGFPSGGFPPGSGGPGGTPPSGAPGGGGQDFAVATGRVTSVAGSTVVISGTLRGGRPTATTAPTPTATPAAAPVTVTIGSGATVTKTERATSAAAVVGKCASVAGQADSAGTVAATAIMISSPGANGCTGGFGRRGAGGGGQDTGGGGDG